MRRACFLLVLLWTSLAAAVEGPAHADRWTAARSDRFIVLTEKGAHRPAQLLKLLDDFWRALARELRVEPARGKPTPVYVFGGRANFEDYLRTQKQPITLAGWCHVGTDGAFIVTYYRNFGPHDSVRVTLRHEATHLFLFTHIRRAENLPTWINEGLAVYYSHAHLSDGKLQTVDVPADQLHRIQGAIKVGNFESLKQHLAHRHGQCTGPGSAQSWSLVYWLLKARDGRRQRAFRRYLFTVGPAVDPVAHFRKVFRMKLPRAQREWREYVLKLEATPRRRIKSKLETQKSKAEETAVSR